MKKFYVIILMAMLVVPAAYSLTAALGNPKAVLSVNATPDQPAILHRTLLVQNRNEVAVLITIEPNEILSHFVDIQENNFELAPGEERQVPYTLTIDRGGKFDGRLNVGFIPADPVQGEHGSGLSAQLLIFSTGPIIEFPEVNKSTDIEPLVPIVKPESGNIDENATVDVGTENFPVNPGPESQPAKPVSKGPSPLTGVLIILGVIIVGLAAFYGVMHLKK